MSDEAQGYHGHMTLKDGSHVPLSREEAASIWKHAEDAAAARAVAMPDDKAALGALMEAYQRLRELGWSEAIYCPKDGSPFEAIEAGSTGIFRCWYNGEWPTGSWEIEADGDIWPSHPILTRLYPEDEARKKGRMANAVAARLATGEPKP